VGSGSKPSNASLQAVGGPVPRRLGPFRPPCVKLSDWTVFIVERESENELTQNIDPRGWALIAAAAADSKKGKDIVIQHVTELLVVTDYFVIATGANDRQVRAIAEEVEDKLREQAGVKPIGREGVDEGKWVLLDFGELIVHVFQPEVREFYRIETLWNDAPFVDIAEAGIEKPEYSERIAGLLVGEFDRAEADDDNRTRPEDEGE